MTRRGAATPVAPTRRDPLVRALSPAVGGPLGDHAGRRLWTPVSVLLALTALAFTLGMLGKQVCADDSWQHEKRRYSHGCYSDIPYLYTARDLDDLRWPYDGEQAMPGERPRTLEYPVGISYVAWGTAWLTRELHGVDRDAVPANDPMSHRDLPAEQLTYTVLNSVLLAGAALVAVALLARAAGRRVWDVAAFAVLPPLALTGIVNWDLLAVACVAGVMWAFSRGDPVMAGLLAGVGTALKLYPVLLLGVLVLLLLRDRRVRDAVLSVGAAVVAWLLLNLPAMWTGWEQWRVFFDANADRGADLGSLWLLAERVSGHEVGAATINTVSAVLLVLACAAVAVLVLRAPVTPRFSQVGFLVVLAFVLVNKVYSPQYVLWLLPLAVLARPRWRDLLVWAAGEALYFWAVWWYLGGFLAGADGESAPAYVFAIAVRVATQLWLAWWVLDDVRHPERDPVRDADPVPGQSSSTRSNVVVV